MCHVLSHLQSEECLIYNCLWVIQTYSADESLPVCPNLVPQVNPFGERTRGSPRLWEKNFFSMRYNYVNGIGNRNVARNLGVYWGTQILSLCFSWSAWSLSHMLWLFSVGITNSSNCPPPSVHIFSNQQLCFLKIPSTSLPFQVVFLVFPGSYFSDTENLICLPYLPVPVCCPILDEPAISGGKT